MINMTNRRRSYSGSSWGEVVTLVVLAMFVGIGAAVLTGLLLAWPVMILVGILHGMHPVVPAFGFWTVLVTVAIIRLVVPTSSSASTK